MRTMCTARRGSSTALFAALSAITAACAADPGEAPRAEAPAVATLPTAPLAAKSGALPGTSYEWTDRSEVLIPRMLPAVVDQPSRGRMLVYGGWQENGVRFDTWEWDGKGWIRRSPLHDPGTRVGATMAFDELRQRVVLVGGATDFLPSFTFDDTSSTWEWNGDDWTRLSLLHSPPPYSGSASAWDPVQNRMLMFGGFQPPGTGGVPLTDSPGTDALWSFDGFDWHEIPHTDPWPPASGFGSMTWDRARNRLVLLTGFRKLVFTDGNPSFGLDDAGTPIFQPVGDLWEWDGAAWAQTGTNEANALLTGGGTVYYDPVQQSVGLMLTEISVLDRSIKQSLRRYEGATWPLVSYAPASTFRLLVNGGWSTANAAPFEFGGVLVEQSALRITTEIALDEGVAGPTWSMQPTPIQMPTLHHAAYAQAADGTALTFGGVTGTASRTADMYRWTGGRWTRLEPSSGTRPAARSNAAMTRIGDDALLFGGSLTGGSGTTDETQQDGSLLGDTWRWQAASSTWQELSPASSPTARKDAVLMQIGDEVLLFGGWVSGDGGLVKSGETWRFDGTSWTQVSSPTSPAARARACGATSPTRDHAVLLGDNFDNEVWTFGDSWSLDVPVPDFGTRYGCNVAYASTIGQMLLIGGGGAPGAVDLWSLTPTVDGIANAVNVEARGERPPRRQGAMFVDNPITGGAMLFGGIRNDTATELADTWQLRTLGQACTDGSSCGNGAFCTDGVCCDTSDCGPCAACGAGTGTCAPSAAGSVPGCDGVGSCNAAGQCRLAPGQECAADDACATGACIKVDGAATGTCCGTEGCAVTCADAQHLRNAEGVLTDCAPYTCSGNRCTDTCTSIADCTGGAVCSEAGKCVPPNSNPNDDGSSCGCKVAGAPVGGTWLGGLAALGMMLGARRRSRR